MESAPIPNGLVAPARVKVDQMRVFAGLRRRLLHNTLRVVLQQSAIRVVSIILTSVVIWGFVFAVSWSGFAYIASAHFQRVPAFGAIIGILFDFLFGAGGDAGLFDRSDPV